MQDKSPLITNSFKVTRMNMNRVSNNFFGPYVITDEELDELGCGVGEEWHLGLPGDGLREEGFPRPGRADEEASLGDLGSERDVLVDVLEDLAWSAPSGTSWNLLLDRLKSMDRRGRRRVRPTRGGRAMETPGGAYI
jgi:hypothetical protein